MPEIKCEMNLSLDTILLLKKMCKEDNVSATMEIENAISGWYRFRHGYTGLGTSDPYIIDREIRNLQHEIEENNRRASIRLSINEEMERIRKSINEEMERIRKSIDGCIREQQEGMKDARKMDRRDGDRPDL